MRNISPPLELPAAIIEFADWSHLSYLGLSLKSSLTDFYSSDSQANLAQLRAALGHRSVILKL